MGVVEIIVLNEEEARVAEASDANRLELVTAIGEGGLTPSSGTIKTVVQSVNIPVMVMVRPHSNSFVYGKKLWNTIREDIKMIKELGAAGIVFGALTKKQVVDFELLAMVLDEAKGISVTFHRAIDEKDTLELYHSLCQSPYHVNRILTSGGKATVSEGLESLKEMLYESKQSLNRPIIMPGSGLSIENIKTVHEQLQATEYHFGSAVRIDGDFHHPIDGDKIKRIKEMIKYDC